MVVTMQHVVHLPFCIPQDLLLLVSFSSHLVALPTHDAYFVVCFGKLAL